MSCDNCKRLGSGDIYSSLEMTPELVKFLSRCDGITCLLNQVRLVCPAPPRVVGTGANIEKRHKAVLGSRLSNCLVEDR